MIRKLLPLALATALALPAYASEDLKLDAETEGKIRATLTADGYDVRKVEIDDGRYEAYAIKDGKKFEVYLDAQMKVVKVEED